MHKRIREVGTVGDRLDRQYLAFLEQEGVPGYAYNPSGDPGVDAAVMSTRKRSASGAAKPSKGAKRSKKSPMRRYQRGSVFPPETKYFDTSFTQTVSVANDWTGTEVPCTNYIQSDGTTVGAYTDSALIPSAVGSGYGQVIGSKYLLKAVRCRGEVAAVAASDQADVISPPVVRVVLVQDTMPQGAQAQGEDVFTDMGNNTQAMYSFLAMGAGKGGRFKILQDDFVAIPNPYAFNDNAAAGAGTGSIVAGRVPFEFSHQFRKPIEVQIKTSGSTPATSQLSNCNIFLLAHSESSMGVVITGCARAYYCE